MPGVRTSALAAKLVVLTNPWAIRLRTPQGMALVDLDERSARTVCLLGVCYEVDAVEVWSISQGLAAAGDRTGPFDYFDAVVG